MVISVSLGAQSYPILLEAGALARAGQHLSLARRVLVVTDSGVPQEYARTVACACRQARICTLPAGENSKNMDNYQRLLREMLALGMDRGDCVAAVGGGMAGDLAGFAAATYMRGVDFYNVPTTLLAQVDSSVGGKTAIDMDGVKNIVGAFHQPRAVLIDTDTLRSLPPRQVAAGLAESVKMAVTCDAALLALIENSVDLTADLPEIIARSLAIKARVVEQDPTEQGLRRVLNFGHTIGHAIESCAGGELLHGECVALGMLPMCAPALRHRLAGILRKCGLPTTCGFTARQLLPYLRHDKKAASGEICIVLADEAAHSAWKKRRRRRYSGAGREQRHEKYLWTGGDADHFRGESRPCRGRGAGRSGPGTAGGRGAHPPPAGSPPSRHGAGHPAAGAGSLSDPQRRVSGAHHRNAGGHHHPQRERAQRGLCLWAGAALPRGLCRLLQVPRL